MSVFLLEFSQKSLTSCQKPSSFSQKRHLSVRILPEMSVFLSKYSSFPQKHRFSVRIISETSDFLSESPIFLSQTSIRFVRNTRLSVTNVCLSVRILSEVWLPVRNVHHWVRNVIFLSELSQKRLSFYQDSHLSFRNIVFLSEFSEKCPNVHLSVTNFLHFVRNTCLSVRNICLCQKSLRNIFLSEICLSEFSQKHPSFCQKCPSFHQNSLRNVRLSVRDICF